MPPFPTTSNRAVHLSRGSHTSNRTCGLMMPVTRQKWGRFRSVVETPGALKKPASTSVADSTVVSWICRFVSLSHSVCAHTCAEPNSHVAPITHRLHFIPQRAFIILPGLRPIVAFSSLFHRDLLRDRFR